MLKPRGRRRAAFAAVVVAAAWSETVAAQPTRYERDTKIVVDVEQTERTRPAPAAPPAARAAPELTADGFIALEGELADIRDQQIALLRQLVAETPDDEPDEKARVLHQLADLYARKQRYWRFVAMEREGSPKTRRPALATAKQAMLDAVEVYTTLADDPAFASYPELDKALFYLAYTLSGGGRLKEARTVYHRLIQDHPQSPYIPEAFLAFADHYFEQGSLASAEQFYDKVLQFPKASVHSYAKYKKGWVFLNLDRPQEALELFFELAQDTRGDAKQEVLHRTAKKDYVRAYAEVGKAQTALASFRRLDKAGALELEALLGDLYLEQGKAEKAIYVHRELITEAPKDRRVCAWQGHVVHAMIASGDDAHKVAEIETLVNLYVALRDRKVLPVADLAACREDAEGLAGEMAKLWHNEALKTLDPETFARVGRLYTLFLASFPDSPEHGDIQYYAAELLWSRADGEKTPRLATELWERAAAAFTGVVEAGTVDPAKLEESAKAAVYAWQNALRVDPRTEAPPIPTDAELATRPVPRPIPPREQQMLAAFQRYVDHVKGAKDDELARMKFFEARTYWKYAHHAEAIPILEDLIATHLDHETSEYAINILLDILIWTQAHGRMIALVDTMLANEAYLEDRDALRKRLAILQRQALRKQVEALHARAKQSGDLEQYVACGKGYLAIFQRDPGGERSDELLYNAGVCFEEGKSMGAAIRMFEQLSERFPDSTATQRAIGRLGSIYGRVAWYRQASEKLEEYARRFGGEDDAFDALSSAVFYRKGIGDDAQALADTERFIKQYRDKIPQAAAALFSMTAIYEKQGDPDKVVRHLRRYLASDYAARGGIDRKVIAYQKIGQILWEQACPVKAIDGACVKITRERSLVGPGAKPRKGRGGGVALPTQCGDASKMKVVVVARDASTVKASRKAFQAAIDAYAAGGAVPAPAGVVAEEKAARTAAMIKAYAAAKLGLADGAYEEVLAIAFPSKLDFDPAKPKVAARSKKRFLDWIAEKDRRGAEARLAYQEIIRITGGGAHHAIAAAARIGQLAQNFSDQLFTAEIPANVRSGAYAQDQIDAFCDELMTQAQPLEDLSIEAFGFCLKTSTDLSWSNEWSQLCERELGQIRPRDFPTASEIRAPASNIAPVIDLEPAVAVKDLGSGS